MRHNSKTNALGRKSAHRKAMLSNMAASLILHKRIKTTVAKAKALRVFIEPIITKSKEDTTHSRRIAFGYLQDKHAVTELFREVSPKVHERPGGYTRILKLGQRLGDAAEVCYIELVDFNETMLTAKAAAEAKVTRRSRRTSRKKADAGETAKAGISAVSAAKGSGVKEAKAIDKDVMDSEDTGSVPESTADVKVEGSSSATDSNEEAAADVAETATEATAGQIAPDQESGEEETGEEKEKEQKE